MFALTYSPEFIFAVVSAAASAIVASIIAFIRHEGKINSNTEKIDEVDEQLNKRVDELTKSTNDRFTETNIQSAARFIEVSKGLEKNEIRVDRVENRHEQSSNEVRSMLMAIQKSLSTLEGKLSINPRNDDR